MKKKTQTQQTVTLFNDTITIYFWHTIQLFLVSVNNLKKQQQTNNAGTALNLPSSTKIISKTILR
jgi:hypothetical protein